MDRDRLLKELVFRTSRSGGRGGQHVNKVETKVEVIWNLEASAAIDSAERALLRRRLAHRLHTSGCIQLTDQQGRTQSGNRERVVRRLLKLLEEGLVPDRVRRATHKPAVADRTRLLSKRLRGAVKATRGRVRGLGGEAGDGGY
jgi:ribosome-associated protein